MLEPKGVKFEPKHTTVHKPEASPPAPDNDLKNMSPKPCGKFYDTGDQRLAYFVEKGIRSQPLVIRRHLKEYVWNNRRSIFSTPCAGTDAAALVMVAFATACSRVFGFDPDFAMGFKCDIKSSARDFLELMFKDTPFEDVPMFQDIADLCDFKAIDHDGNMRNVPLTNISFTGCQ